MSKRHRMLLIELTAVRMPGADVTCLHRAYASHVEYTRQAYMDYCNGLQDAMYTCHHLHICAPAFASHVQVLKYKYIYISIYKYHPLILRRASADVDASARRNNSLKYLPLL